MLVNGEQVKGAISDTLDVTEPEAINQCARTTDILINNARLAMEQLLTIGGGMTATAPINPRLT